MFNVEAEQLESSTPSLVEAAFEHPNSWKLSHHSPLNCLLVEQLAWFLEQACDFEPGGNAFIADLKRAFIEWVPSNCPQEHVFVLRTVSDAMFSKAIQSLPLDIGRVRRCIRTTQGHKRWLMAYTGVALKREYFLEL